MVAGYHLIWTVYGYLLPNDPRGSTSLEVRVPQLIPLGELHYGRKQVQPSSTIIRKFYQQAQEVLKHPVLTFDESDILLLGEIIGEQIAAKGYTCYACAIMPDHVHLLIRRHRDKAEQMIAHFQETTRTALIGAERRRPGHPVWTKGPGWKGFMNIRQDFERTVKYIRNNTKEIGRQEQSGDFVQPYYGWLPRNGH